MGATSNFNILHSPFTSLFICWIFICSSVHLFFPLLPCSLLDIHLFVCSLVILRPMLDRLEAIKARFDHLGVALTNPAIVNDNRKFTETSKEYRSLEKIVNAYSQYRKLLDDIS